MTKLWNEDKAGSGTLIRIYADDNVADLVMDINDLFEDFYMLEVVQRAVIINGIKQKIADTIARSKDMKLTEAEKRETQEALWLRLSVDKEWNMPKASGKRSPSVTLKAIVPALQEAGMDAKKIASITGKSLEAIEMFIESNEKTE